MQEGFVSPIVLSRHLEESRLLDEFKMNLGTLGLTDAQSLLEFDRALGYLIMIWAKFGANRPVGDAIA